MGKLAYGFRPTGTVSKEQRAEIMARWDAARDEYKRESSAFTRLRRSLPPEEHRNQAEMVMLELGRRRYKAACVKYHKERELMNYELYQDRKAEAVQDIVQQLKDVMQGIPVFDLPTAAEIKKRDEVRDALAATGDFDTIRQAAIQRAILGTPEQREELELTDDLGDGLSADTPEYEESSAPAPEDSSTVVLSPEELIARFGIPEKQ